MEALIDLLGSIVTVAARRLAGKRRHGAWPFTYEVGVEVCGRQVEPDRILTKDGTRKAQGATPLPLAIRSRLRFERTTLAGMAIEQHTPREWDAATGQVVLYIHGGGYFACSPGTHRALIGRLAAAAHVRCVAPDYRLAPEHPFPAALDDSVAAYLALLESGVEPARIFVGGDSAGGGLTLGLLQRLRSAGTPLPRGVLLLSPWVDLEASGGTLSSNAQYDYLPGDLLSGIVMKYVGTHSLSDPLISPIQADLRGLPPMLMFTGALEIFADQNRAFAARAQEQGVDMTHLIEEKMVHVYPLLADVSKAAQRSFQEMAAFLRRHA